MQYAGRDRAYISAIKRHVDPLDAHIAWHRLQRHSVVGDGLILSILVLYACQEPRRFHALFSFEIVVFIHICCLFRDLLPLHFLLIHPLSPWESVRGQDGR